MLVCEYDTIIQGSNQCKKSVGGVRKSWGIDWQNVESVQGLAETGTITGLTLKEGKTLKVLEYDNDNTASYNQTTNRVGLDARVEQVATLKFTGANVEKSVIANKAKGVHNGLWFHLQNDGTIHSQGAEFGAKGDKIITSLVGAKVNPNINSNTGEGSSDVTWNIVSTSTDIVPVTMTMEDLDTLVGEDTGDSDMGGSDIVVELPSVMILPLVEGDYSLGLTVVWDDGGDSGAVRSLNVEGSNGVGGTINYPLDTDGSEINLLDVLCVVTIVGSTIFTCDIIASITNSAGSDSDSSIGSVIIDESERTINDITCIRIPAITINPPVDNILPLPTITDGCGCGLDPLAYSFNIDLGLSTIYLESSDFPYDLMALCGQGVDYSWRTDIAITVGAQNNIGGYNSVSLNIATVTFAPENINPPFIITSINGVAC